MAPGSVYCGNCDKVSVANLGHLTRPGQQVFIFAPIPVFLMVGAWDASRKKKEVDRLLGLSAPSTGVYVLLMVAALCIAFSPLYRFSAWIYMPPFIVAVIVGWAAVSQPEEKYLAERRRRQAMATAAYGRPVL